LTREPEASAQTGVRPHRQVLRLDAAAVERLLVSDSGSEEV